MVIRRIAEIGRVGGKITHYGRQVLAWTVCALALGAGGAVAAPYAQPGQALQSGHEWAMQPLVRAGLCGQDDGPCPEYERPRIAHTVHTRRWEPEPEPPVYEERTIIQRAPDCVEDRVAVRTHVVHETTAPLRSPETFDEPCGIRCWYKRLRAGYCGRGCDYYRFRMTQFPGGRLGSDRIQVACR